MTDADREAEEAMVALYTLLIGERATEGFTAHAVVHHPAFRTGPWSPELVKALDSDPSLVVAAVAESLAEMAGWGWVTRTRRSRKRQHQRPRWKVTPAGVAMRDQMIATIRDADA